MSGSRLWMRLLEPGGVTLFESMFKSLKVVLSRRILELFRRALLLEILLSRRVQLRLCRQRCTAQCFFSGLLTDIINSPFFHCRAVTRAMTIEHRNAAYDDRGHPRQQHEPHQFESSGHNARA